MAMLQNEGQSGAPNVLHDQGFPNTLAGVGLASPAGRFGLPGLTIAAALAGLAALVVLLVILFARLA